MILTLALLHSRNHQNKMMRELEQSKADLLVLAENSQACSTRIWDRSKEHTRREAAASREISDCKKNQTKLEETVKKNQIKLEKTVKNYQSKEVELATCIKSLIKSKEEIHDFINFEALSLQLIEDQEKDIEHLKRLYGSCNCSIALTGRNINSSASGNTSSSSVIGRLGSDMNVSANNSNKRKEVGNDTLAIKNKTEEIITKKGFHGNLMNIKFENKSRSEGKQKTNVKEDMGLRPKVSEQLVKVTVNKTTDIMENNITASSIHHITIKSKLNSAKNIIRQDSFNKPNRNQKQDSVHNS